ncbi:segregation/condensation protein A [Brevibacillus humidisoli]|uniref:segregation and condensation protein A n=1 Tax=Brevibacillus humidisoli TaxID=2895522 RepID=UPI001E5337C3|nr:segregation/condensation protein A [Brevibacillus humidisoli]UFJ42839.1 segregation/condensation protein A [Brevibacillus humidisoli]
MAYSVKLDSFEGPLDLLLHLIDKAEVDIYDIPVAEITEQYLQILEEAQERQLEVASEFVVMAATLLSIKSKMLLPKKEEHVFQPLFDMDVEEADPRDELVQRLLEYKRYKMIAEHLREMETGRSQVFTRPAEDLSPYIREEQPVLNVTLYDMLSALEKLYKRRLQPEPLASVSRDEISVKDRMREIKEMVEVGGGSVRFSQLFSERATKTEIVTTFLAILELMKAKQIACMQSRLFSDILICTYAEAGGGESDGLRQVEGSH